MNNNSDLIKVVDNVDAFTSKLFENQGKIYVSNLEFIKTFGRSHLPDGILSDRKIYLPVVELDIFSEYFLGKGHVFDFQKGYYICEFANSTTIGCKGDVTILSRYFSNRSSLLVNWGSEPRGVVSKIIHDTKEGDCKNNFMKWDSNLVESLDSFLMKFITDTLEDKYGFQSETMKKDYGPRVVLTALPNHEGGNRFSSFLNQLNLKFNEVDNLLITDNLFMQNFKPEPTRGLGYEAKRNVLNNLYSFNKNYKDFFNNNTKIVIVDDVLTTGVHFEIALEALKMSLINYKYTVSGVFLSATQGGDKYGENNILKLKNTRFKNLI